MTWKDRLQPEIELVSPSGEEFVGLWRGDPRRVDKKLGIFEFPGLVGAEVQDLEVGADTGTLSFSFEGPDHDLEARRFFKAVKQSGLWTIEHPVYGKVKWQFSTIKEDDQPVDSANITAFSIEWIEPSDRILTASLPQITASVRNQATVTRAKANEQADASVGRRLHAQAQ